jgi:hypothetical protein
MSNLQRQVNLTKGKQFLSHQGRQKFAALAQVLFNWADGIELSDHPLFVPSWA